MFDPVTLAALIGATLGNVALNVAGARADALLLAFGVAVKAKITGQDGSLPTNHDVQRAVRLAHVEALRATLADFVRAAPNDRARRDYARRMRDWLAPQVTLLKGADPNWPSTGDLIGAIDQALSGAHESQLKANAEAATWAELERATQPVAEGFRAHFLGEAGARGWFAAFGAFIGDGIKTNPDFRSIFAAAKQAELSQKLDAYAEDQAREAAHMREQVASMLDTLTRIEDHVEDSKALLIHLARGEAIRTLRDYSDESGATGKLLASSSPLKAGDSDGGQARISIERLPESHVSNLVGREAELAALDAAWADRRTYIACLVGFGGVGKSALVQHWLARLAARNYDGARAVFAWSFEGQNSDDQEASADAFVAEALSFFGGQDAPLNARERGLYLAQLIQSTPSILILDGLEVLQAGEEGQLRDPAVSALLKVLAAKNSGGLCVLTTRNEVDELKPYVGQTVHVANLAGLSVAAGTSLLRGLGVKGTDQELGEAVQEYRGHALFLTLLAGWLRSWKEGDIRRRSELDSAEPDSLRRMMSSYEQLLGSGPELDMLHVIGLFNRPAPLGAINAIRTEPPIPHLTDNITNLTRAEWNHVMQRLRDLKLILDPPQGAESADPHFDAHAMVSNYFSQRLRDRHSESWIEANRRLFEFYRARPEQNLPDTLEEMSDLFQAVVHGCRANAHEEAWQSVYWPRIRREQDGFSALVLAASGADLVALSGFFEDGDWERPVDGLTPQAAARACTEAGFDLRGLGRLDEAIQAQEAGLSRHRALNAAWEACDCAGNLSETLTLHGQLGRAEKAAEESIAFARVALEQAVTPDVRVQALRTLSTNLATLADVQHQRGQFDDAERTFADAERVLRESAPTDPESEHLSALRGFHHCDLLLTLGRADDAMRLAEYAERVAKANERRYPLGLAHLMLARLSALRGQRDEARALLQRASEELRQSGFTEMILRALLCSAEIHALCGEYATSRTELEEALEVAASASMRLLEMDAHVQLTELEAAIGDMPALRAQLEIARRKVRGFSYKRREAKLTELASITASNSNLPAQASDQMTIEARYGAAQAAFLEAYLALDPVAGTSLGIPGDHDARLPLTNKRQRDLWLNELESRAGELTVAAASTGRLDDRIDAELAQAGVRGMRINESALDPLTRNPGFYVEAVSRSVYSLLARADLEFEEKVEPIVHRLQAIPQFLEQGEQNVKGAARVLLDNAIGDAEGAADFLRGDCRAFLLAAPKGVSTGDAHKALAQAEAGLSQFVQFLKRHRGRAAESFALGEGPFDDLLRNVHLLRQDARDLRSQGEELVSALTANLKLASSAAFGHERWWKAISLLEKKPPTKAGLLADYRTILGEAREHVRHNDVVGLGKVGSLVVLPTPPFARANLPFAAYISSPPFARTGRAEFWVSPPAEGHSGSAAMLALSRHHRGRMAVACVHEGYPGHHVQFAHAAHVKRPIRHLFASNVFSEGWGLYCEDLMRREGFLRECADGGAIEISMLRDQLWRALRIVIDVGLHCFGMTRKGAVDLLVKAHVLDRPNAEAEVMYYCSAPTQPMSYMIGRLLMEETIQRCHALRGRSTPIGRVRDEVLSHGSLPFPLLERAMGIAT